MAYMVPSFSKKLISTKSLSLLTDRDFIFNLVPQSSLTIYTYINNHKMLGVLVRNITNKIIHNPRKY